MSDYHVNLYQRRIDGNNAEPDSKAIDLRGGPITGLWVGSTHVEDAAVEPTNFYEVNINLPEEYTPPANGEADVRDPFFQSPSYAPNFPGRGTQFVELLNIDHNENSFFGGGPYDAPTPGLTRQIDLHPVVQDYVVYHANRARWFFD